ncbi:PEP-CTERM/exosortase system-associated acyltransferase [Vibrio sp. Of7-15]|uniref:PEP-CTERM/exosortase system-associated acyltransferase n=1 Tax=Vibrio sp. Of7-15 TaxID=2724879 RepID=UPI001EF31A87|nr:PEP-CTERM/exosortase system-associated acyltransferase [Vibrio sp. Of7-15]MCG7495326.1 PEP-CTERM/exosortase system-associated acyltransferase [Vibrio sp. Of7-15]
MIKNKFIKKLSSRPILGFPVRKIIAFVVKREAQEIAHHFAEFLRPVVAYKPETINQVYHLRHDVYCKELAFEPPRADEMETDEFDRYSRFCMLQHRATENYAGCVRIVSPRQSTELLPIEKYCEHAIKEARIHPAQFHRSEICEISRLAVRAQYRRRQSDKFEGAAVGTINETTYSEVELRCFPFIAIGLYLSVASLAVRNNIKHAFVMMEPRLARSMRFVGIHFEQLGPAVEYHGKRAPYYINAEMLTHSLPISFQALMGNIDSEIAKDCMHAKEYARLDLPGSTDAGKLYSFSHGPEKPLSDIGNRIYCKTPHLSVRTAHK